MFRFTERLSSSGRTNSRRYLKRAGLFAGGLVLLWIALQLFPSSTAEPPVYSDEAGSVASSRQVQSSYQGPRIFTLGNMAAFILLVGGGAFAYFMHKRSIQSSGGSSLIESIGELTIGQGQQLRLVRCGGEVLLIGTTPQEITLIRNCDPNFFEPLEDDEHGSIHAERTLQDRDDNTTTRKHGPSAQRQHVNTSKRSNVPTSTHFSDVLRQYAGRYVNIQSNGRTC